MEYSSQSKVMYINDARTNLGESEISVNDNPYWNVKFLNVLVNGYPAAFLITTKEIQSHKELLLDYGELYNDNAKTSKFLNKIEKDTKKQIENDLNKIV